MFKTREDELVLIKHKHQQMLKMFRDTLTRVSNLKQSKLDVQVSANFMIDEFRFDITVFERNGTNTTLAIYDFWELKKSQKLVDTFLTAIRTGDFGKVKAVECR